MNVAIIPFDMSSPEDAGGLRRALRRIPAGSLLQLAVIAKVEGPARTGDPSRELASGCIGAAILRAGGAALTRKTVEILSVGCEGITTPGGWLIASLRGAGGKGKAAPIGLAVGQARSAPMSMRERATRRHVSIAAQTVRAAMRNAGLDARSVELVLIKSPILLPEPGNRVSESQRRHVKSTGASRGAAALGAAIALGEVRASAVREDSLCSNWVLHSSKTMAFSGTETECCEAVVLGNRSGGDPSLRIDRAVLADILDRAPLEALAAGRGGLRLVFYKAGIGPDGAIRGARTTVLTSELPADKQLRAAASGVVGTVFGTTRAFISGGAEHQAVPGGCLAAVIRVVARG